MKNWRPLFFRISPFVLITLFLFSSCKEDDPSEDPASLADLTTTEVQDISAADAISGGNISGDGGAAITARGLVWGTAENPTTAENEGISSEGEGTDAFTSTMTNLLPYTTYFVRAYATNSAGTAYGNQLEFKTLPEGAYGTVTDIDGNEYYTTEINNMEWMAQNLRVTRYPDGTPIATGLTAEEWATTEEAAYVELSVEMLKDAKYIEPIWELDIYGFYYNAMTVMYGSNPCPDGWNVATEDDWEDMKTFMEDFYNLAESEVGDALKSCRQENSPLGGDCETDDHPRWNENSYHYGTNRAFFLALPAGFINQNYLFEGFGEQIFWWEPANPQYSQNYVRRLSYDEGHLRQWSRSNNFGCSLRCIRPLKKK